MGKFQEGDRVVISKTSYYYGKSDSNPTDSVQGTIKEIRSSFGSITVNWDNGTENGYSESDLEFAIKLEKFKRGDRVVISKTSTHYGTGPSNPSEDVKGKISDIYGTTGYCLQVKWDNGNTNGYRETDLVFASETDKVRSSSVVNNKPTQPGTWYIYSGWFEGSIAKLKRVSSGMFEYSEAYYGGSKDKTTHSSWSYIGTCREASADELSRFLPTDHPENPNKEALPSFIVGKWYTSSDWSTGSIAKFKEIKSFGDFGFSEAYTSGRYKSTFSSWGILSYSSIREATLSELEDFLPIDHSDNPKKSSKSTPDFYRIKTKAEMILDGDMFEDADCPSSWAHQMIREGYFGKIIPPKYYDRIYNLEDSEESVAIESESSKDTWWVKKRQFTTRREIYAFDPIVGEEKVSFDSSESETLDALDKMSEEKPRGIHLVHSDDSFKFHTDSGMKLGIPTQKKTKKTEVILLPYKKRAII